MPRKGLSKLPAFVEAVVVIGIREASRFQVDAEAARDIFMAVAQATCAAYGGKRSVYVTEGLQYMRGHPWDGRNGTFLHAMLTRLDQEGLALLAQQLKLPADQAKALMHAVVRALLHLHGGSTLYVPAHRATALDERDERVMAAWEQDGPDGVRRCGAARADQLAVEFGLSAQHIYVLLARVRRLRLAASRMESPPARSGPRPSAVDPGRALQAAWTAPRLQPAEEAEEGV